MPSVKIQIWECMSRERLGRLCAKFINSAFFLRGPKNEFFHLILCSLDINIFIIIIKTIMVLWIACIPEVYGLHAQNKFLFFIPTSHPRFCLPWLAGEEQLPPLLPFLKSPPGCIWCGHLGGHSAGCLLHRRTLRHVGRGANHQLIQVSLHCSQGLIPTLVCSVFDLGVGELDHSASTWKCP